MTDRDEFAKAAMQGLLGRLFGSPESLSKRSFEIADHMLKELTQPQLDDPKKSVKEKLQSIANETGNMITIDKDVNGYALLWAPGLDSSDVYLRDSGIWEKKGTLPGRITRPLEPLTPPSPEK